MSDSFLYNGKPVLKKHFRTFVYGANDTKKLCESWELYQDAVASGLWFDSKESVAVKTRKKREKKESNDELNQVTE